MGSLGKRKILVILDELQTLKPQSDTSLAFISEFCSLGEQAFVCRETEIFWNSLDLCVNAKLVLTAVSEQLPSVAPAEVFSILDFDLVLIRKDPPFDSSYLQLCWFLAAFEDRVKFVNRPSVLLRHHEKMMPFELLKKGVISETEIIPTCVTSNRELAEAFVAKLDTDEVIVKPWLGFGGNGIRRFKKTDFYQSANKIFETDSAWMIQAFEETVIQKGDRRVHFLNGKVIGHFVRFPKAGDFISNLAQGGRGELVDFDDSTLNLVNRIGKWLLENRVCFAGVDLIGDKLTEINITCPTGLRTYEKLSGQKIFPAFTKNFLEKEKV